MPEHDPAVDDLELYRVSQYEKNEGLSDELRALARGYDPDYQGEISGRWIKLNHFVWEKFLSDLGHDDG